MDSRENCPGIKRPASASGVSIIKFVLSEIFSPKHLFMKKKLLTIGVIILCVVFTSCGGKESAASLGKKWCDLNGKAHKAEGAAKEAADKAVLDFENEIATKYKDDKAFMDEVEKESEKCEAASEGR
jgi:hypothetical protein